jgi:general secretion pathway protein B
MSYILDALKKAEAERHMGSVPNLHVQPSTALPLDVLPLYRKKSMQFAAVTLVAMCIALAWVKPWQSAATRAMALPQQAAHQTESAQAAPSSSDIDTASPVALKPAIQDGPEILAVSPEPKKPKQPVRRAPAPPPKKAVAVAKKEAPAVAPQPLAVQASTKQATAKDADLKISTSLTADLGAASLRELPEQIQRELPTIVIGGYIYSDIQRERQLLVNRRLVYEGEEAAPGVVLEKMLPKAAVFNYKGYRYRIAY